MKYLLFRIKCLLGWHHWVVYKETTGKWLVDITDGRVYTDYHEHAFKSCYNCGKRKEL